MGWREVGDELFAEVREQWLGYATAVANLAATDLNVPGLRISTGPYQPPDGSPRFGKAVYEWERGDPDDLITYLRSDRPIVKGDRQRLIDGIRRKSGRPNHRPERPFPKFAASLSLALYKEWCARNRKANVSSRGYARHMQDACAEFIAGILEHVDADQIRQSDERQKGTSQSGPNFAISARTPHP